MAPFWGGVSPGTSTKSEPPSSRSRSGAAVVERGRPRLARASPSSAGVLASAPERLRRVFLLYGTALGLVGTGFGLILAAAISWVMNRFELISFGPEVASIYFLRAVPFRLSPTDAAWIALFAAVVTLLSCWLPSRRALKLDPSAALRFE